MDNENEQTNASTNETPQIVLLKEMESTLYLEREQHLMDPVYIPERPKWSPDICQPDLTTHINMDDINAMCEQVPQPLRGTSLEDINESIQEISGGVTNEKIYIATSTNTEYTTDTVISPSGFNNWTALNIGDTVVYINGIPLSTSGSIVGLEQQNPAPNVIWGEDINITFDSENPGNFPKVIVTLITYRLSTPNSNNIAGDSNTEK